MNDRLEIPCSKVLSLELCNNLTILSSIEPKKRKTLIYCFYFKHNITVNIKITFTSGNQIIFMNVCDFLKFYRNEKYHNIDSDAVYFFTESVYNDRIVTTTRQSPFSLIEN